MERDRRANGANGCVQRQVVTTNGAVTFVGNALGLNKDGTNDRPGTSGSLGTFITTDTSQRDNPEWPQGTTGDWRLNSSSAVLSLPSGSRIIHAELIWGGSYLFGSEDVSDFLNDPINFTTPTGTTQVTRDPTTAVTRSGPQQNSYVRTANVTALVSAAGSGTYTVGRVPATQATDEANFNSAGWTLAILYENAGLPTRSLSLFVGLEPQGGATASVSGICTPDNNGKLRARVAVSASGGDTPDPGNTRDSLRFGPSSNLSQDNFRLSGPNNPAENFFASQINRDDGELDTRGTFGDRNNDFKGTFAGGRQGWDITNVDASPELTRQQTAAFAQGTADGDDFFITALAMQIDVVAPAFGAEGATECEQPDGAGRRRSHLHRRTGQQVRRRGCQRRRPERCHSPPACHSSPAASGWTARRRAPTPSPAPRLAPWHKRRVARRRSSFGWIPFQLRRRPLDTRSRRRGRTRSWAAQARHRSRALRPRTR